jgi:hypothetical protein
MSKYFYEKSNIINFKSNITYHELLQLNDSEFKEWCIQLRKEVIDQWDNEGIPPTIGSSESDIYKEFSELKNYDISNFHLDDQEKSCLGILQNFSRMGSVVNQFFPTMLKVKVTDGKNSENAISIYDNFKDENKLDKFITLMKSKLRKDSMYSFASSLSVHTNQNQITYNGETCEKFLERYKNEKSSHFSEWGIWIFQRNTNSVGTVNGKPAMMDAGEWLYMTADEIKEYKSKGLITDTMLVNVDKLQNEIKCKNGNSKKCCYLIRYYQKNQKLFPTALQIFRLSLGQPVVNFPPMTAKWLYEKYTYNIKDSHVTVYDPSAGWGGRIVGALSARRNLHYVGTDPNMDNYLSELKMSRYEYVANIFNKCNKPQDSIFDFSECYKENTCEIFQDGSELIHNNKKFQKYKGKLDFAFTSPPYFNREQYSNDPGQSYISFKSYESWRDGFLKPTLITIYQYLKRDRYIAWNIADIKIDKNKYFSLEKDSIDIAENLGFVYKGFYKMIMASMIGVDQENVLHSVKIDNKWWKYEPIFIFYKK